LQKEFKAIKPHQQAIYDFVMQSQKSTTFSINDNTITIKVGTEI